MQVGPRGGVVVIGTLLSDQIPDLLNLCIGGFKSQLFSGVRIELAVGSLPYPQLVWVEGVQTPWMSS